MTRRGPAPNPSLVCHDEMPMVVRDETSALPSGPTQSGAVKVVFALSGWAEVASAHECVQLCPGSVLTIGAGLQCWGVPMGAIRTGTFYLHPVFLADQVRWLPRTHPLIHLLHNALGGDQRFGQLQLPGPVTQYLLPRLSRLAQLCDQPGAEFALLSATAEVLHTVGRTAGTATARRIDSIARPLIPRVEVTRAASLLRCELSRPWRMEDLARTVALSPSQLGRLFRIELGISPAAYLSQLRAERMAELLSTIHLAVSEAAHTVGWHNSTVAARAFKRRYGVSPRTFAARSWEFADHDLHGSMTR